MTDRQIKEPCPFCGETAENIQIRNFRDSYIIYCPKCCTSFDFTATKETTIKRWNIRHS